MRLYTRYETDNVDDVTDVNYKSTIQFTSVSRFNIPEICQKSFSNDTNFLTQLQTL